MSQIPQSLSSLFVSLNNFILLHPLKAIPAVGSNLKSNTSQSNLQDKSEIYQGLISLRQFWYSQRLCVTLEEFEDMLISIGFFLKEPEKQSLIDDNVELITLENVLEGVEQWKYTQKDVATFLSKKQNPISYNKNSSGLQTNNLLDNSSFLGDKTDNFFSSSYKYKNIHNTKSYLKQHSRKQQSNKLKLANTLKQVKNQSDYEITVKVGEVNDICRRLKNGYSYILDTGSNKQIQSNKQISPSVSRAEKNGGTLKIIECQKSGEQVPITLKIFQRKYESYKQVIMNVVQEFEGSIEEDLRKVLVEVMCLSSEIKQQVSLLESKGISS